jgi:hypothetical protein
MSDGLLVLVDDVRSFRDGRSCRLARSAEAAIALLAELRGASIAELWLDHDLAPDPTVTVMPVVEELVTAARSGSPHTIQKIFVHTVNPSGAVAMRQALAGVGIATTRWYDTRIFVNRRTEEAGTE